MVFKWIRVFAKIVNMTLQSKVKYTVNLFDDSYQGVILGTMVFYGVYMIMDILACIYKHDFGIKSLVQIYAKPFLVPVMQTSLTLSVVGVHILHNVLLY